MQVDLLVLDTAPQPLDEHVVDPTAFAVLADADGIGLEWSASTILTARRQLSWPV